MKKNITIALAVILLIVTLTSCNLFVNDELTIEDLMNENGDIIFAEHDCVTEHWCDQYGKCFVDGIEVTCCLVGCGKTTCDGITLGAGCGVNKDCEPY